MTNSNDFEEFVMKVYQRTVSKSSAACYLVSEPIPTMLCVCRKWVGGVSACG